MIRKQVEVIFEERVPVFASGLGTPDWVIQEAHAHGVKVISLAGNVKNACRMVERGSDVIVAQGHEAGGHTGRIGTMALVPQVVDAVAPTPVLAAGGIGDGRGLVAALALGAVGVWVGTAFVLTHEAFVDFVEVGTKRQLSVDLWRQRVIAATEEDTRVTRIFTGKPARRLMNKLVEVWEMEGLTALPMPLQGIFMDDLLECLYAADRREYLGAEVGTGQICGMLKEVKSAQQVVDEMVEGAARILEERFPAQVTVRG